MEYVMSIDFGLPNQGGVKNISKIAVSSGNHYEYNVYFQPSDSYTSIAVCAYRMVGSTYAMLSPIEAERSNPFVLNIPKVTKSECFAYFASSSNDPAIGNLYVKFRDDISIDIKILYNHTPPTPIEKVEYKYSINNEAAQILTPPKSLIYNVNKDNSCELTSIDFYTYLNDSIVDTNIQIINTNPNSWIESSVNSNTATFTFNSNESSSSETISIYGTSTINGNDIRTLLSEITFNPSTDIVKDPEYWNTGDIYSYIDTNLGEVVDPDYLLNSIKSVNIYNTLSKKDNVLFVGNYNSSIENSYDIKTLIESILGEDYTFIVEEEDDYIEDSVDSSSHVSNKSLSLAEARCFKEGETYMLGIVFKYNNGNHSDVYYIGDYSPSKDASLSYTTLIKPIATTVLDSSICNKLYEKNIIGIIPVVAKTNSQHKVICQGLLGPTIKFENTGLIAPSWKLSGVINNDISYIRGDMPLSKYSGDKFYISPNFNMWTINTPELELGKDASLHSMPEADLKIIGGTSAGVYTPKETLELSNNGEYPLSGLNVYEEFGHFNYRWKGFIDPGTTNPGTTDFINSTGKSFNYGNFPIYVWQRQKMGGESPESKIISKSIFGYTNISVNNFNYLTEPKVISINNIEVFNSDVSSIVRVGTTSYSGNVDTILTFSGLGKDKDISTESGGWEYSFENYYLIRETNLSRISKSYNDLYAGYDKQGRCTDPIYISYKSSPHIVFSYNGATNNDLKTDSVQIVELLNKNYTFDNSEQEKKRAVWVKCGDIVRVYPNNIVTVKWKEGDWFLGSFDSLKTMPFSSDKYQSYTYVCSCVIMSRYNLGARTDINRKDTNKFVNLGNFNLHNPVYEQEDNFFTYSYLEKDDISKDRTFKNTVQYSLPKRYGDEVDTWCNIQESNYLDLDGDKGELIALRRFNNNILAFQETGVSQILYNENVQISTENNVPIEIANSGKVQGKRYLWENKGCQNRNAIAISQSGLYFIDGINRTAFLIGDGNIIDIFSSSNMKSWALSNLNKNWWCYYDLFSQEILFTSNDNCLAFDDVTKKFQCFLSYENVKYPLFFNGRTYLIQEANNRVNWNINNIWKKNESPFSIIKDSFAPLELELQVNPEPTEDKIFTTIEYRADSFTGELLSYNENGTFNTLQVDNEYQDTGETLLSNIVCTPSNLKKKFRIWRVQIPRDKDTKMDRIRNPWCNIKLRALSNVVGKFIIHDIKVSYLI